jgi:hypothetical protein
VISRVIAFGDYANRAEALKNMDVNDSLKLVVDQTFFLNVTSGYLALTGAFPMG